MRLTPRTVMWNDDVEPMVDVSFAEWSNIKSGQLRALLFDGHPDVSDNELLHVLYRGDDAIPCVVKTSYSYEAEGKHLLLVSLQPERHRQREIDRRKAYRSLQRAHERLLARDRKDYEETLDKLAVLSTLGLARKMFDRLEVPLPPFPPITPDTATPPGAPVVTGGVNENEDCTVIRTDNDGRVRTECNHLLEHVCRTVEDIQRLVKDQEEFLRCIRLDDEGRVVTAPQRCDPSPLTDAVLAPPFALRCPWTCPHGDRCTLPRGHEGGHNHVGCDCNEPDSPAAAPSIALDPLDGVGVSAEAIQALLDAFSEYCGEYEPRKEAFEAETFLLRVQSHLRGEVLVVGGGDSAALAMLYGPVHEADRKPRPSEPDPAPAPPAVETEPQTLRERLNDLAESWDTGACMEDLRHVVLSKTTREELIADCNRMMENWDRIARDPKSEGDERRRLHRCASEVEQVLLATKKG